jgi:hypothetical protein
MVAPYFLGLSGSQLGAIHTLADIYMSRPAQQYVRAGRGAQANCLQ